MEFQPLQDRVLIEQIEENAVSPSGIVLPEGMEKSTSIGKVVAVGSGRRLDNGEIVPINVSVGDKVFFSWGEKVEIDRKEYQIVNESSILGKFI